MTLITVNKTSQGYSFTVSDRVAVNNKKQAKASSKVINNYLTKLQQA